MRLNKLELKGFKSFRDKTVLEFPSSFTIIVGPNGSGKSNLTEAICFVLGKSRGLRASNVQELIYNGGLKDKPADETTVSVYLTDNGRKYKITRAAYRDGRSVYELDDKRTTRENIVQIVGDNEYNIILQDDVVKVIDMAPKERREIIDDLCGIAEYDRKKEKAIAELEKVENRISDTSLILGEKEVYLSKLKNERDEALKYTQVQDDLMKSKATILHHEISKLEERSKKVDEKVIELQSEKEKCAKDKKDISEKITAMNKTLKDINLELIKLEEEKTGGRVIELKGELKINQDRLSILKEKLNEISNEVEEKNTERETLEKEVGKIEQNLKKVTATLADLKKDIEKESSVGGVSTIERDIDNLRTKTHDIRSKIGILNGIKDRIKSDLDEYINERSSMEEDIKRILDVEQRSTTKLDNLTTEHKSKSDKINESKKKISKLNDELEDNRSRLKSIEIEFASKNSQLKTLEQTGYGVNNAIRAVIRLKEVISGIYGPVYQLGKAVKTEHEMPLQIAAGSRMLNIVVENEDVASKCIDYLRKKEVGRATFLPLNRIKVELEEKPHEKAIGFARDFIKTEKTFERVFDYVFGNTLLVKDIGTAKSIGIGEWRMVTLDSDLLEIGGAITGGHIRKTPEIIFSNVEELENEINIMNGSINRLRNICEELLQQKNNLENELPKIEREADNLKNEIEKLRIENNSLIERKHGLDKRVRELNKKIEESEMEINKNESARINLETDVNNYENQLSEILKKRRGIGLSYLDELKDKARDREIEEGSLGERKGLNEQRISTLKKEINDLRKNSDAVKRDISDIETRLVGLKGELTIAEKRGGSIIEEIEGTKNKRTQIESQMQESGAEIAKLEIRLEDINEKMSKTEIEKAQIDVKLEELRKEFKQYKNVEIIEKKTKDLEGLIARLEFELSKFGYVNMKAIEAYEIVKKEVDSIKSKLETLKGECQSIFDFMEKIEQKKREVFMEAFEIVKKNFENIFARLSNGKGTLMLDNPKDISESGLIISASPGGKKIMSLDAMSGGEKVLTSSAFLLAIQQYKPAYFYIVDEMDAALDKTNSMKLAEMLKDSDAQFILVTHNDAVMTYAETVIGVSMSEGYSQVVGVKLT